MFSSIILALALNAQPVENASLKTQTAEEKTERRIRIGRKSYAMDEVVCKKERVTGSRVKKKLCNTARQWQIIEERSRVLGDEMKSGVDSVNRGG